MPLPAKSLTLIVATTLDHGIGQNGALPWPMLKSEMAYFARVTKRPPASSTQRTRNAVVMGRKTWESIPKKFRPLKDRVNCVVSTTLNETEGQIGAVDGERAKADDVIVARTLEDGISALDLRGNHPANATRALRGSDPIAEDEIGHIFIIGGASVYASALKLDQARRILLTKIKKPSFECDTFFPLDLESDDARERGWQRKGTHDLETFIGEKLGDTGATRLEGDIEYEFRLYERADSA